MNSELLTSMDGTFALIHVEFCKPKRDWECITSHIKTSENQIESLRITVPDFRLHFREVLTKRIVQELSNVIQNKIKSLAMEHIEHVDDLNHVDFCTDVADYMISSASVNIALVDCIDGTYKCISNNSKNLYTGIYPVAAVGGNIVSLCNPILPFSDTDIIMGDTKSKRLSLYIAENDFNKFVNNTDTHIPETLNVRYTLKEDAREENTYRYIKLKQIKSTTNEVQDRNAAS